MMPHLMMLSLPNSGSTWLFKVMAPHLPCRSAMEFFNPARNEKYERELSKQFGAELVSCYRNIATEGGPHLDKVIAATWGVEAYGFTKEVFSPFKLDAFVRHFQCFVLLRKASETFPPTRPRVWSFYEHAWFALAETGFHVKAQTMRTRALEAHRIMTARLTADATRLRVPVLWWSELFEGDNAVAASLRRVIGEAATPAMIEDVIATRARQARPIPFSGLSFSEGGKPHPHRDHAPAAAE
jgi:hypothetical protein